MPYRNYKAFFCFNIYISGIIFSIHFSLKDSTPKFINGFTLNFPTQTH